MKRTTQELYGIDPRELEHLSYREALETKLEGGERRLGEVLDEFNALLRAGNPQNPATLSEMQANNYLQSDIYRAIRFTEELLEELSD